MPRVLIVEDDPAIVEAVEKSLTLEPGFSLRHVGDARRAVAEAAAGRPDLILLDVRLPTGDGRVVLKALKANAATRAIPVIMLTGMSGEGDKVVGLNLGADDYVVKPFGAMELLARIQAVLRRAAPAAAGGPVTVGPLVMDPAARTALVDGQALKLQPREFDLLFLLASRSPQVVPRAFLIENTSSYGAPVETRALDTHVKNLRRKLGRRAAILQTVPKHGYRLAP